jgi:tetratricopeptide (TPR) repeat protein
VRHGTACLIAWILATKLLGFAAEAPKPGNSDSPEAVLEHAQALIKQGHAYEAAIEVSAMLESSPDFLPGLKLYARLLAYDLENEARAEEILEKCLKMAPSDPELWQVTGNIYLGERRYAEAVRYLENAARLAPRNAMVRATLAMSYERSGDHSKAVDMFRQCMELNRSAPKPDAIPPFLYGQFLLDLNDAAGSIALFSESLRMNAQSSNTYFGRARAHEQLEHWPDAITDAQAALRYEPGRLDASLLLLRVYRALHDQAKVDEYTAKIKQINDGQRAREETKRKAKEALRLFMEVLLPLLRDQKCQEAIKPSLQILDLYPSLAQPLFVLGVCYGQTGQPDLAISYLQKFLSVQPNSEAGHAALGVLLLQQNRTEQAREELQRAVAIDPSLETAKQLLDQLPPAPPKPAAPRPAPPPPPMPQLAAGTSGPAPSAAVQSPAASPSASGANAPASASFEANLSAAATAIKQSDFARAAGLLEAAIASRPSCDPEVYIMLATCRSNLKQGPQAIEACERGLKQHSRSPRLDEFYLVMLRTWAGEGEIKAKLVESVRRNPGSTLYAMALAERLLVEDAVGFEAQIEPLVKKAVMARPLDPEAHYLYGRWACLNAHNDVSARELVRALELTHDNDRAKMQIRSFLAITYTANHEMAKAEQQYQKAAELARKLTPFEPLVLMQYARFLEFVQRADEAQKINAELLQRAPEYGPAHLLRARFLSDHNKFEEAAAEGELGLKYAGEDLSAQREAHLVLGKTYHALGRAEEAKIHQEWVKAHSRS